MLSFFILLDLIFGEAEAKFLLKVAVPDSKEAVFRTCCNKGFFGNFNNQETVYLP
jgi:hypothetical protein